MKKILLLIALLITQINANFVFSECSGSGTFEQEIEYYGDSYENAVTVGTIPAGIEGLRVELISDKDVDIRLYGANNEKIVHWPYGLLRKSYLETKLYQDVNVTYSGYNGVDLNKGHEFIEVNGSTPEEMTMKAFGYRSGYATVNYSWTGKEGCTSEPNGTGTFQQTILDKETTLVGTIPPNINNVKINLTSETDIDIQLYGADGTPIIAWSPTGLLSGPSVQNIVYNDMNITWSGYNGIDGEKGHEYIHIEGNTTEMLVMKVYGYEAGNAEVTYSWGEANSTLTVSDINYTYTGVKSSMVGTNVPAFLDYSTSVAFVDLFKLARPFDIHSSPEVEYDAQGWPIRLNGGIAETYTMVELDRGGDNTIPLGDYTILYDGVGTIVFEWLGEIVSQEEGKAILRLTHLNGLLHIKITSLDESNPIRNIRIIMPGGICADDPYHRVTSPESCPNDNYLSFLEHHKVIRYNPDYLRFLRNFTVVRYMDTMNTNNSPIKEWDDMLKIDSASWSSYGRSTGSPIELLVDLANRLQINPWFCMPHQATDDFITQFATYIRDNLDDNLTAYVEHSNEVWNGMFGQSQYAKTKGIEQNLGGDAFQSTLRYHSKRSVEIFTIWENVFGNTNRFVRVMGGWAVNDWSSNELLSFQNAYTKVDALATAPYFGDGTYNCGTLDNVDTLFGFLVNPSCDSSLSKVQAYMQNQKQTLNTYGVDMISYEGGQHMVKWGASSEDTTAQILEEANKDSRISDIYFDYLNMWKNAGGGLFMHYSAPGRWDSRYGYWGVMESLNQTRNEMPKYDGLMRFIESNQ